MCDCSVKSILFPTEQVINDFKIEIKLHTEPATAKKIIFIFHFKLTVQNCILILYRQRLREK